jgi:hypothetical protein
MGIIAPAHKKENKMSNISQEKLGQFRETIREILDSCTPGGVSEEIVLAVVSAARIAFTNESDTPARKGTFTAMIDGLTRVQTIKATCHSRFGMNYHWDRKEGQDMLEFLSTRPDEETLDKFADWWENHDWRGQKRQPPTLGQIYEYWPQAFQRKESERPQIYRAGDKT